MKKIIIVGATSAIAEQCARKWAAAGPSHLVLVGRDADRLQRVADDLKVRSPLAAIDILAGDFAAPDSVSDLSSKALELAGGADIVLIAHGSLPDQERCQQDLTPCREGLMVNGVSPVLFAEAFAREMATVDCGCIAIIGSVAGDRGRRSNYVYGAAKGLVDRYAQGMQHRFAGCGLRIVLVKPGPTDTPMTAHLRGGGLKLADVGVVAELIVAGIERGSPCIYAPAKWRFIMLLIRHMPRFVFNRLNI